MGHLIEADSFLNVQVALVFHSANFAQHFINDLDRWNTVVPGIKAPRSSVIQRWLQNGILLPSELRLSYADVVIRYEFGDTFATPRPRNIVIDLVFATIFDDQLFPLSSLRDMNNRKRSHCSLRKLLVDVATAVCSLNDTRLKSELIPKESFLEVLQTL